MPKKLKIDHRGTVSFPSAVLEESVALRVLHCRVLFNFLAKEIKRSVLVAEINIYSIQAKEERGEF